MLADLRNGSDLTKPFNGKTEEGSFQ